MGGLGTSIAAYISLAMALIHTVLVVPIETMVLLRYLYSVFFGTYDLDKSSFSASSKQEHDQTSSSASATHSSSSHPHRLEAAFPIRRDSSASSATTDAVAHIRKALENHPNGDNQKNDKGYEKQKGCQLSSSSSSAPSSSSPSCIVTSEISNPQAPCSALFSPRWTARFPPCLKWFALSMVVYWLV